MYEVGAYSMLHHRRAINLFRPCRGAMGPLAGRGLSIPERVAQLYYSHGVFCASHPIPVVLLTLIVIVTCCCPLVNLPLPGNVPQEFATPLENYSVPPDFGYPSEAGLPPMPPSFGDSGPYPTPRWFRGPPAGYVQQLVVQTAVSPWTKELILTDAFRAPLAQVFRLLEILGTFQLPNSSQSLGDVCLHVEGVKPKGLQEVRFLFPEYNCLLLSPANFWGQNLLRYQEDPDIIGTIFSYQGSQKAKGSLAELFLGMKVKETGFKRYPIRTKQRMLTYAVTIVFKEFNMEYVEGLRTHLTSMYPVHMENHSGVASPQEVHHIYFASHFSLLELIPLSVTYCILFLYVYFSVRKIELVKSKLGMALSALVTVVASLCMSVGICTFFGLSFALNGKEIFPYVVVIIGLENILVLTKSVVSTPTHLDVKIRVAQGLSREGWSITKNLLTEVTILTVGFFTFVPAIQEFCIFAVVGLLSDFFLQMLFFATLLSIDIRRMEQQDLPSRPLSSLQQQDLCHPNPNPLFRSPVLGSKVQLVRTKSSSQLNGLSGPTSVVAPPCNTPILVKLPKRLRLVYFWARTRIFQRAFMVFMVVWISIMIYRSGIVDHLHYADDDVELPQFDGDPSLRPPYVTPLKNLSDIREIPLKTLSALKWINDSQQQVSPEHHLDPLEPGASGDSGDALIRLRHGGGAHPWPLVSAQHWPTMFGIYNVSLAGNYISLLPPIHLAVLVDPDSAVSLRHPQEEKASRHFNWQALASALDPSELSDSDLRSLPGSVGKPGKGGATENPFVPTSPAEFLLMAVLVIPSVIFVAYLVSVLYRCVCTRNYAEWRASWGGEEGGAINSGYGIVAGGWVLGGGGGDAYTQVVMEALPLQLEGHSQDVECLATDGNVVVSSCLAGQLRVWDSQTGECLTSIDRRAVFMAPTFTRNRPWSPEEAPSEEPHCEFGSPPPFSSKRFSTSSSTLETDPEGDFIEDIPAELGLGGRRRLGSQKRLSQMVPDLSSTIETDFASISRSGEEITRTGEASGKGGSAYDFGRFQELFEVHMRNQEAKDDSSSSEGLGSSPGARVGSREGGRGGGGSLGDEEEGGSAAASWRLGHRRNLSAGELESVPRQKEGAGWVGVDGERMRDAPPIWCLDCQDGLVALGCGSGRVEFWEASAGKLKCVYDDGSDVGVTSVKLVGNRTITARLNGTLDFLELSSFQHGRPIEWNHTPHRRTHVRTGSAGSVEWSTSLSLEEDMRCQWLGSTRAHQQAVAVLECEGGRVVSGSQDHTLKVFRLEDQLALYTLHGHCGPIACLFIDRISPMAAGSGSQDGMLCVWDLLTGTCVYSIQAHDGSVVALAYSASYVISMGADEKLCVWERFQGHLLNTIQLGSLVVWDVRQGEAVRVVRLGHSDASVFVRQMVALGDGVVCDYGNQLRLVRFPLVAHKAD